ncbi:MAG: iron ABC transporter permease [Oxalobacter sp.]|nr:MAG: iron ABC transporter permease [Oxalobacter sp.]
MKSSPLFPLLHLVPVLLSGTVLFFGAAGVEWHVVVPSLWEYAWRGVDLVPDAAIVWEIRLPRILLALVVGATLSGSGATMQTMFRNPLVDPFMLGISAGAAFGCALSVGLFPDFSIQLVSLLCAIITAFVVLFLARTAGGGRIALVLSGVIVSAFLMALTSAIKFFVPPDKVQVIVLWLMGSFGLADWPSLRIAGFGLFLGFAPVLLMRWRLNLLSLGNDEIQAMGMSAEKMRVIVIVCLSFASALAVSVSGIIGWVGLITPHIARTLVGSDMRRLLPTSISLGAGLMLLADTLARTLTTYDLPVGIVTALLGAPFFVYLLRKARCGWTQG